MMKKKRNKETSIESLTKLSYSDLLAIAKKYYESESENEKKFSELEAENKNLKCQLRIMTDKYNEMWYENKLQMSTIVKYRRLIEHYEDGAPNYVATH